MHHLGALRSPLQGLSVPQEQRRHSQNVHSSGSHHTRRTFRQVPASSMNWYTHFSSFWDAICSPELKVAAKRTMVWALGPTPHSFHLVRIVVPPRYPLVSERAPAGSGGLSMPMISPRARVPVLRVPDRRRVRRGGVRLS